MKTTSGKTKAHRPAARPIRIWEKKGSGWRLIAVKKCSTLKQALTEYYKETLQTQNCERPTYTGNVLTVHCMSMERVFCALELSQDPVPDRHSGEA